MSEPLKFCAVVRRPPIGSRETLEILRLSLGMVLLGDDVAIKVILQDDGVYHAMEATPAEVLDRETARNLLVDGMEFDMLAYVVQEDLAARGLREEDLVADVKVIPAQQVAELVGQSDTTCFM